uniref:Coiled-coil domain-containing protein 25 n=1 Tax=Macaca nemestrina TaxID=9545 RepID=A0A2K6C4I7_MACNE
MVFYFTSSSINSFPYTIYIGKDKYENEDLIKHGWPEDIWEIILKTFQRNSIQGCKMNHVNVVYTPRSNLKKTADMDVGQIGFHRQKDVKIVIGEKKVNEILNQLEKTKVEWFPDLAAEKECRDREERSEKKAQIQEMKRRVKEEMKKREMVELRSYLPLMKVENMSLNQDGNDSDESMLKENRTFERCECRDNCRSFGFICVLKCEIQPKFYLHPTQKLLILEF